MPGGVLRHRHGQRNGEDRLGIDRSHRLGDEVGRRPHLVDDVEGRAHDVGKLLDLPEPVAGGVTAVEEARPTSRANRGVLSAFTHRTLMSYGTPSVPRSTNGCAWRLSVAS